MKNWVIDDFLPFDMYLGMAETFPNVTNEGVRAMNDLYCGDPEYASLDYAWHAFHDMVFSQKFWATFLPDANNYKFNADFREHRNGNPHFTDDKFLYARIDIGVATEGYGINNGGRGLHIDNRQRVISGLLYFTDQSEIEGGEFLFCNADGATRETVELKENRCVMSEQTAEAWHKVNPLRKGTRRFVYFSLNSTWNYWRR